MKRFIVKIGLYFIITLSIIITIACGIFMAISKNHYTFSYESNSISYNMKAGFIDWNLKKFNNAKIIVIGSSMDLNNIDALMIEQNFNLSTFNVASWSMKLRDFTKFHLWDNNNIVICNIQFPDFGNSEIEIKNRYTFEINKFSEIFNIILDHKTYMEQIKEVPFLSSGKASNTYEYCKFDECGSVLFNDSNFKKNFKRWNMDYFKTQKIESEMMNDWVADLKGIIDSHKRRNKIIITFSPSRGKIYSQEKSELVQKLGLLIKEKCTNVYFIDKYDLNYSDNLFVDSYHFNKNGADKFTREIMTVIKEQKLIN